MIEVVVEKAINSLTDEVVVLGHEFETIQHVKGCAGLGKPLKMVYNQDFRHGLSTSIKAGLRAINQEACAAIFILADQPLVQVETINQLIENHSDTGYSIVVPVYRGLRGNPVLVDRGLFEELFELEGMSGLEPS